MDNNKIWLVGKSRKTFYFTRFNSLSVGYFRLLIQCYSQSLLSYLNVILLMCMFFNTKERSTPRVWIKEWITILFIQRSIFYGQYWHWTCKLCKYSNCSRLGYTKRPFYHICGMPSWEEYTNCKSGFCSEPTALRYAINIHRNHIDFSPGTVNQGRRLFSLVISRHVHENLTNQNEDLKTHYDSKKFRIKSSENFFIWLVSISYQVTWIWYRISRWAHLITWTAIPCLQ